MGLCSALPIKIPAHHTELTGCRASKGERGCKNRTGRGQTLAHDLPHGSRIADEGHAGGEASMTQNPRTTPLQPGRWKEGPTPANATFGVNTIVSGELAFKRFHGNEPDALIIGAHCTMDGVHFDVGERGRMTVGDYCYFTNAVLLCELEVRVGSYVVIGWNA